jgi:DnaA family protein
LSAQQLPLSFRLRDDATFDNYLAVGNQQVLHNILELLAGKADTFIYLWGSEGSGKSHLLQACCHAAPEYNKTALYLPLAELFSFSYDAFHGLENVDLICLDDIDQIAGNRNAEEQVFHFFNRIRAQGNSLLIAANVAPLQLKIALPDLKSRLAWGIVYQLHALDDAEKLSALQLHAKARGLELDESVGNFLLGRCARNMTQLFATLELLDQASLIEQRRLTIPFVKRILGV